MEVIEPLLSILLVIATKKQLFVFHGTELVGTHFETIFTGEPEELSLPNSLIPIKINKNLLLIRFEYSKVLSIYIQFDLMRFPLTNQFLL